MMIEVITFFAGFHWLVFLIFNGYASGTRKKIFSKMSRPGTQMSGRLPPLPKIKHPLAERLPGDQLGGINIGASGVRPLAAEARPGSRPPSNLFKRRYGNVGRSADVRLALFDVSFTIN